MKSVIAAKLVTGLLVLSSGMSLVGCVEVTRPICNSNNMVDVAGLEGDHSWTLLNQNFEAQKGSLNFSRLEKGVYGINGSTAAFKTCTLGNMVVSEAATEFSTYKINALSSTPGLGFSMSLLVISEQQLKDAGINYEIVERVKPSKYAKMAKKFGFMSEPTKEKVMVIKNDSEATNSALGKYGAPNVLGTIFQ